VPRWIGVDGAPVGWVSVILEGDGIQDPALQVAVAPHRTAAEWAEKAEGADGILVDIPIGLPDGPEGRACDVAVRSMLGPRRASVFSPPTRGALAATTYREALQLQRAHTGTGFSIQAWNLVPRIREVDLGIRSGWPRVYEAHPELLFMAMAGGTPMALPKRTPDGREERWQVLERWIPGIRTRVSEAREGIPRRSVAEHDLLDALAAAMAGMGSGGRLERAPQEPEVDGVGIPMSISWWDPTADLPLRRAEGHAP